MLPFYFAYRLLNPNQILETGDQVDRPLIEGERAQVDDEREIDPEEKPEPSFALRILGESIELF